MIRRPFALAMASLVVATRAAAQQAPPAPLPMEPAEFPPFRERTLSNGARLVVVTQDEVPFVDREPGAARRQRRGSRRPGGVGRVHGPAPDPGHTDSLGRRHRRGDRLPRWHARRFGLIRLDLCLARRARARSRRGARAARGRRDVPDLPGQRGGTGAHAGTVGTRGQPRAARSSRRARLHQGGVRGPPLREAGDSGDVRGDRPGLAPGVPRRLVPSGKRALRGGRIGDDG